MAGTNIAPCRDTALPENCFLPVTSDPKLPHHVRAKRCAVRTRILSPANIHSPFSLGGERSAIQAASALAK